MAKDIVYRLLAMKFNISHMTVPITPGLINAMKDLYSPEEAWLLNLMPMSPASAKTIARSQFKNQKKVEEMLMDLVSRGLLIEFSKNGVQKYMMAPLVPGVLEMQLMKGEDTPESRESAQRLHDNLLEMHDIYFDTLEKMDTSFARVIPVNREIPWQDQALPYEDVRYIINDAKKFAVANCYCRTDKYLRGEKTCNAPLEICMAVNFSADFLIRNNIAKEVDRDTMLKKLDIAEEHNLVHMTDNTKSGFTFICNCCGCCCGLLGASTVRDRKAATVASSLIVEWNAEKCNHCGKCGQACQVNALSWINKVAVYSENRCIGCGECIDSCPKDALRLIPRKGWKEPTDSLGHMVADMMARRIKASLMLPIKKLPGHNRIAAKVNEINKYE